MTYLKHALLGTAVALALGVSASAQNVLVNGDFSQGAPSSMGNHVNQFSPPGWTFGSGQRPNVVTVDGPNGYNYGTNGPESDASGTQAIQHYLDIANGGNTFHQTFTPECDGNVRFGGAFSTRGNGRARASIAIREGSGQTGAIIGSTNQVNMPGGTSKTDPWTQVDYTTALQAGTTYSFVVTMDNNSNFDDGYVEFERDCQNDEMINLCCPPWTENKQGAAFQPMPGPGGLFSNYGMSYQNVATSNQQMQAYANYLDAINPNFASLNGIFEVKAYGTGNTPVGSGTSVNGAGQNSVMWTGNNTVSGTFWSGFPFQQNVWYGFTTTITARDNARQDLNLFNERCEPVTVYYRVQSLGGTRSMINGRPSRSSNRNIAPQFILQKSDGKRILSETPIKTGRLKAIDQKFETIKPKARNGFFKRP